MGMIVTSRRDDALIIAMSGKWMGTGEEYKLIETVREELQKGTTTKIVLDLKLVEWANSYGIGQLAGVMTSTRDTHLKIAMANVPSVIKKMLDISFLSSMFTLYPSVDKALKALS